VGDAHLFNADLTDADLRAAYLRQANLSGADLTDADLRTAYLYEATGVTNEQLERARALEGASMPNESQYHGGKLPHLPACPSD
jgi:uncharacterized protein YjbI with pentapeptide repeats